MSLVTSFGTNPGNLTMYLFSPNNPVSNAPVVLVMHGCSQTSADFATETGWNVLAEEQGFYVIHAGQSYINNGSKCFNWFLSTDNERDLGEAKSLAQMVDYVHGNYNTNINRTYVCGLSAGGCMTAVMMATYPEKFNRAGIWAGNPYKYSLSSSNNKTPQEWGDFVRNANPTYSGNYPGLFICQGTNDVVVDKINATRLMQQWTNIHNTDTAVDFFNSSYLGNSLVEEQIYMDSSGNDTSVILYNITGMSHGIAVNPGTVTYEGGQTGTYSFDVDFYSTFWMARFFGLINVAATSVSNEGAIENDVTLIQNEGEIRLKFLNNFSKKIELYDLQGRLLVSYRTKNKEQVINTSNLSHSIFVITIKSETGIKSIPVFNSKHKN